MKPNLKMLKLVERTIAAAMGSISELNDILCDSCADWKKCNCPLRLSEDESRAYDRDVCMAKHIADDLQTAYQFVCMAEEGKR